MTVQEQLFDEIHRRGGRVHSLRAMVVELGIDYDWAWRMVARLERAGLVMVERRPGYPLVILANPCAQSAKSAQFPALETLVG